MSFKRKLKRRNDKRMELAIRKRDGSEKKFSLKEIKIKNAIDNYIEDIGKYEEEGYQIIPTNNMEVTIIRDTYGNDIKTLHLDDYK